MTPEQLNKLPDDDLWQVYENCQKKQTEHALSVKNQIEALIIDRANVSVGDTGVKLREPFGKLMAHIINSPDAKDAAIAATTAGEPALAGIEPLLTARLGLSYAKRYEATIQAGTLVRKMMEQSGFVRSGTKGPMPAGSVAKTSEIYIAKVS